MLILTRRVGEAVIIGNGHRGDCPRRQGASSSLGYQGTKRGCAPRRDTRVDTRRAASAGGDVAQLRSDLLVIGIAFL